MEGGGGERKQQQQFRGSMSIGFRDRRTPVGEGDRINLYGYRGETYAQRGISPYEVMHLNVFMLISLIPVHILGDSCCKSHYIDKLLILYCSLGTFQKNLKQSF